MDTSKISKENSSGNTPHLTPANLVGRKFSKDTFKDITVALVGYCPQPGLLEKYNPWKPIDQYFIHIPPTSVLKCKHGSVEFLSIAHVYGGPVSSALIEELAYYGIKYLLAYGLAGGLGSKSLNAALFQMWLTAMEKRSFCDAFTE